MPPSRKVEIYGLLIACFLLSLTLSAETHYFNGKDFRGGYVVVPDTKPNAGQKWWVVVDVHGAGGLKNEKTGHRLLPWLGDDPVILLVPSFKNGYQTGDGEFAEQLLDHFKWARRNYPAKSKMFIHGTSGGAQFAHRFVFNHPNQVIGASVHSAGSWATGGGYGDINRRAKRIPFALSCGESDKAHAWKGSPHNRIDWFRLFSGELKQQRFTVGIQTWPEVGHGVPMKLQGPMIKECFLLATEGVEPSSDYWSGL